MVRTSTGNAQDEDEEDDGPPEEGVPVVRIPGGLDGLRARKEAERTALGIDRQPPGKRAGEYTLPHQDVRTSDR
ncbi:hypothetical protein OC842_000093 [Tilletia horrida]|uniref:Uncharacterized protein n=1 Tax=Tilletia horrida TaxID=155126 RepID=A0AAN6JNQ0_9BASI|nr:hypothetical protein OC842_000093 [Tilletia horrida]KAK0565808.1 hypothetical protein OC844_001070 [Tilletia horrida]